MSLLKLYLTSENCSSSNEIPESGFHIGIQLEKGIFLHFFSINLLISKDGVHHYLKHVDSVCPGICYLFLARLIAIIETLFFIIMLPFSMIIFTCVTFFCLICGILFSITCPFKFDMCCLNSISNRKMTLLFFSISLSSLLCIFKLILEIILIPFQIIVPELTALVFKIHKLGSNTFDYLH